ncbi:MAG TPA: hypothetical protein ENN17_02455 [bacterium]|nr:hypothetical protein [bacterium]
MPARFLLYPAGGTVSRTARVPVVRRDLKWSCRQIAGLTNRNHIRGSHTGWLSEFLKTPIRGWCHYFGLSETIRVLEELDGWICHRYRCVIWRR